jgi:hypothetical protein
MVGKIEPEGGQSHMNFSSWARYVPDFFASEAHSSRPLTNHRSRHDNNITEIAGLKSPDTNDDTSTCNTPDLSAMGSGSQSSGYADLEQAKIAQPQTAEIRIGREGEGETLQEFMATTRVDEERW